MHFPGLSLIVLACLAAADINPAEKSALLDLYSATNGAEAASRNLFHLCHLVVGLRRGHLEPTIVPMDRSLGQ